MIAAHLLHDEILKRRIGSVLLVDPVTFLLHLPDVAYNFTRRKPRRANEHMLYYFSSTDMCVANTIARHLFWAQNILWKEEIMDRNVTVSLAGRDMVTNPQAIARYLTDERNGLDAFDVGDDEDVLDEGNRRERGWRGEGLDVLWYERLDHAGVFDRRSDYIRLVEVLKAYCYESD
jgi:hypothetical protein